MTISPFLTGIAGRLHLDDAEHAADGRRDERDGAAGAQLAVGVDGDLQRALRDRRGRHGVAALRQARHGEDDRGPERRATAMPMAGQT